MRSAPAPLVTFMNSRPSSLWKAELITFTLSGGSVLRYTSADYDIEYDSHTYTALGPYVTVSRFKTSIGLSVDSISMNIIAAPTHQVNTVPVVQAMLQGIFDGAEVLVKRMIGAYPGDTSLGAYIKAYGFVSDITDIGVSSCSVSVKPKTEKLNQSMPRNLIQPGCRHTLFDAGCTLAAASFDQTGTVTSGSTVVSVNSNLSALGTMAPPSAPTTSAYNPGSGVNIGAKLYFVVVTYVNGNGETVASLESSQAVPANQVLKVTSPSTFTGATGWNVYVGNAPGNEIRQNASPNTIGSDWTMPNTGMVSIGTVPPVIATDGYYAQGWVVFNTGVNSGVERMVLGYSGGTFTVVPGLPFTPGVGDTFTIYPGCDKQQQTCAQKFSNLINFGGFPYVPTPEVGI